MVQGEEERNTRKIKEDNKTQDNRKGIRRGEEGYTRKAKEDNKTNLNVKRNAYKEDDTGRGSRLYTKG